jgi:hypothetical protein
MEFNGFPFTIAFTLRYNLYINHIARYTKRNKYYHIVHPGYGFAFGSGIEDSDIFKKRQLTTGHRMLDFGCMMWDV